MTVIAAGVLLGCTAPTERTSSESVTVATAAEAREAPVWITLVTGDRVLVSATGDTPTASVVPGPGRERMSFSMTVRRGSLYVMPTDAAALVAAGTLDAELFDVTALARFGYDDARRSSVPVIAMHGTSALRGAALARMSVAGAQVTRALSSVDGMAMEIPKDAAADIWGALTGQASGPAVLAAAGSGEIRRLWLDGLLHPTLDHSVPQIGAPAAWAAGLTGKDVVVAVLDSGLDDTHPDFAGKVVDARNFTTEEGTLDRFGHGTHVASTIAGSGAASGGRYRGVAPDARLLIGKVCTAGGCAMSSILAGIEWAAVDQAARIVNMSLGAPDTLGIDPIEEAINRLSAERGTLFVVSAGNDGLPETIATPGSAEAALTVGAVDGDDLLAVFSSRGPRRDDGGIKPDVTAPGVGIVAALAAGTELGEVVDDVYVRMDGTSMATPHVAGAAALLLQQHPDWRGDRLKAALMTSARPSPDMTPFEQGTGRVDVEAAISQAIVANPASLNLGIALWPHGDDAPVVRTVSYTNASAAEVTLQLVVDARRSDGQPAPPAMFNVSPGAITVPAGGAAGVTLTTDTRVQASDGAYTGRLVATSAAGVASAIPFTIQREPESYDLSLVHIDQNGAPASQFQTLFARLDGTEPAEVVSVFSPDGHVGARLPRGRYLVYSIITTGDAARPALLVQPSLSLVAASTVTFDSRAARPIHITVPRPAARQLSSAASFQVETPTLFARTTLTFTGSDSGAVGQVGPPGPAGEFVGRINAQFAEPGPAGDFFNSPAFVAVSWSQPRRFFTGFDRRVRDSELAAVHADYRASGTDQTAIKTAVPANAFTFAELQRFSLPFRRTEYYNADGEGWEQSFQVIGPVAGQTLSTLARYRPGRDVRERWNAAVFGPAFRTPAEAVRSEDQLVGTVALFSDGAGHRGAVGARGVTRLFQGTENLGELPVPGRLRFRVHPGKATYRLETEATRIAPEIALSTHVTAAWTFRSEHAAAITPLPLLAVRFAPPLDDHGRARAGAPLVLPISVARNPGAPPSRVTQLTIDVSYDDGATWQRTPIVRDGDDAVTILFQPATASFVSLRASAADAAGNRVEQTVIHAYALRR